MNRTQKQTENAHFLRKLNHLAAFAGMPDNAIDRHAREAVDVAEARRPAAVPGRIGRLLLALKQKVRDEVRLRQNLRELRALNDHVLRDIGLQRGDIAAVAARAQSTEDINAARELLARPACKIVKMPLKTVDADKSEITHLVDNAA